MVCTINLWFTDSRYTLCM